MFFGWLIWTGDGIPNMIVQIPRISHATCIPVISPFIFHQFSLLLLKSPCSPHHHFSFLLVKSLCSIIFHGYFPMFPMFSRLKTHGFLHRNSYCLTWRHHFRTAGMGHSVVPGRTMCARHWGCPGGSGDGFTTGNHHGNTLEKWWCHRKFVDVRHKFKHVMGISCGFEGGFCMTWENKHEDN